LVFKTLGVAFDGPDLFTVARAAPDSHRLCDSSDLLPLVRFSLLEAILLPARQKERRVVIPHKRLIVPLKKKWRWRLKNPPLVVTRRSLGMTTLRALCLGWQIFSHNRGHRTGVNRPWQTRKEQVGRAIRRQASYWLWFFKSIGERQASA
jgi:hypothetical protein